MTGERQKKSLRDAAIVLVTALSIFLIVAEQTILPSVFFRYRYFFWLPFPVSPYRQAREVVDNVWRAQVDVDGIVVPVDRHFIREVEGPHWRKIHYFSIFSGSYYFPSPVYDELTKKSLRTWFCRKAPQKPRKAVLSSYSINLYRFSHLEVQCE